MTFKNNNNNNNNTNLCNYYVISSPAHQQVIFYFNAFNPRRGIGVTLYTLQVALQCCIGRKIKHTTPEMSQYRKSRYKENLIDLPEKHVNWRLIIITALTEINDTFRLLSLRSHFAEPFSLILTH